MTLPRLRVQVLHAQSLMTPPSSASSLPRWRFASGNAVAHVPACNAYGETKGLVPRLTVVVILLTIETSAEAHVKFHTALFTGTPGKCSAALSIVGMLALSLKLGSPGADPPNDSATAKTKDGWLASINY